jgi:hypothetical protein
MSDTRIIPSVNYGMAGEVNQFTAIDERNDLHARRQNMFVQFLHFLVDALQGRVRRRAFP